MSLAAIIYSESKLFLGYTDDAENFTPESNTTLVGINQSTLDQLLTDASTESMMWDGSIWIPSNRIQDVKNRTIKEAKAYFKSIDKFYFEEEEYRISLKSLRNLWTDNEIRKKDIELNTNECFDFTFNEMEQGELSNLGVEIIEKIVVAVRCYKRQIQHRFNQHIQTIQGLTDVNNIINYDFTTYYPLIPNISQ